MISCEATANSRLFQDFGAWNLEIKASKNAPLETTRSRSDQDLQPPIFMHFWTPFWTSKTKSKNIQKMCLKMRCLGDPSLTNTWNGSPPNALKMASPEKSPNRWKNDKNNDRCGHVSGTKSTSIWSPVWTPRNRRYIKTDPAEGILNEVRNEGKKSIKNRSKNTTPNLQVWSHLNSIIDSKQALPQSSRDTPIYFMIFQDLRFAWNVRMQPSRLPVFLLAAQLADHQQPSRKNRIRCKHAM